MLMISCSSCGGLTPRLALSRACLHCGVRLPRTWLRRLLGPAGAVLLAACYGPPVGMRGVQAPAPTPTDKDGDGATSDVDCDDNDPTRYPGAPDPYGDGIDQNCDGVDGWRDPAQKIAAPPDGGT